MEHNQPARNVDDYLATLPQEEKTSLENLRKTIRSAAPNAVEKISYQIPTFDYYGPLVAFSMPRSRSHCSFHLMSPSLMSTFKAELKQYKTTTATINFHTDKPLPVALVKKLVNARMEENKTRHDRRIKK